MHTGSTTSNPDSCGVGVGQPQGAPLRMATDQEIVQHLWTGQEYNGPMCIAVRVKPARPVTHTEVCSAL